MNIEDRPAGQGKRIGGRLCLDFVNTVGGWSHTRIGKGREKPEVRIREDKLNEYPDLLAWGRHVGLLTEAEVRALSREAARHPKEAAAALGRARALREAIYRICISILHGAEAFSPDLDHLNRELAVAYCHLRLKAEGKNIAWKWAVARDALDRMLWPVADSAAELLITGDLARLRECHGELCGWLFEDTSKNSRRQWCDMQTCGNLAKVRRFRERQQG